MNPGSTLNLENRDHAVAHDHAVAVYETEEELAVLLDAFIERSLRSDTRAVFIHAFADSAAATNMVRSVRPDAEDLESRGLLALVHCEDAFEEGGRIEPTHATGVVARAIEAARSDGRAGIAIFVDASRRYLSSGREEEWFSFEHSLGTRLKVDASLVCAYRRDDIGSPARMEHVLRTHAYRFVNERRVASKR